MDPTLSMLMANQAMVRPGDLVVDPFVGTGSLLIAAAKYGGMFIEIFIAHIAACLEIFSTNKHI